MEEVNTKAIDKGNKLSFEHYLNAHKNNIRIICLGIEARTDYRVEYDDLYQEAVLKLFILYENNKPLNVNLTKQCIRNCLIDYKRRVLKGKISDFDISNLLYSSNEREYEE